MRKRVIFLSKDYTNGLLSDTEDWDARLWNLDPKVKKQIPFKVARHIIYNYLPMGSHLEPVLVYAGALLVEAQRLFPDINIMEYANAKIMASVVGASVDGKGKAKIVVSPIEIFYREEGRGLEIYNRRGIEEGRADVAIFLGFTKEEFRKISEMLKGDA
jgi:hypothetical protein